jgi:hypothetical protein
MRQYRYKVGQLVKIFPRAGAYVPRPSDKTALRDSRFEVTRLLPETGSDFQYRIRNAANGQERVVVESEIGLIES